LINLTFAILSTHSTLRINILDETDESDTDSDLSDHEDFYLSGEDPHIKMEVSVTRSKKIKQLFYSDQVPYCYFLATIAK